MFSLRSASVEHVVRGVRTLLGIDPSPGGLFAPTGTNDGLAGADPRVASTKVLRAETSVALVQKASDKAAGSGRAAAVHAEKEAMAEARGAIELIVLKQGQPVELQPREAAVVERQVALAREFGLRCEVAGASAAVRRVRILPAGWAAEEVAPVQVENKEYW